MTTAPARVAGAHTTMPIKPENAVLYPPDWSLISRAAKERAGWKCQHPGCTASQYSVGRWIRDEWHAHADYAATWAHARQMAAEYSFFLFGDGPAPKGEPRVIVIVLTTAHLDHDPANCAPANLAAMCQRHHLQYDQQHHNESAYMTRMSKRGNQELPLLADLLSCIANPPFRLTDGVATCADTIAGCAPECGPGNRCRPSGVVACANCDGVTPDDGLAGWKCNACGRLIPHGVGGDAK